MHDQKDNPDDLMRFFVEREKELECLYRIEEIVRDHEGNIGDTCMKIVSAIPSGWQYPKYCRVRIELGPDSYSEYGFTETSWMQSADIIVGKRQAGKLSVFYSREMPEADDGPFLRQEKKLLSTIADRIGSLLQQDDMKVKAGLSGEPADSSGKEDWKVILNLLRFTDKDLYYNVTERMLNHLCWEGVSAAEKLQQKIVPDYYENGARGQEDENRPMRSGNLRLTEDMSFEIFRIATSQFTGDQIYAYLQKWIQDDRLKYLIHIANRNLTLPDVIAALRQYRDAVSENIDLSPSAKLGVIVSLVRRFLSSQLDYINIAKNYFEIADFFEFLDKTIYMTGSHGRLGGKCAGLVMAKQIIRKSFAEDEELSSIKVPNSWYMTSDILLGFLKYNNMDEVVEQKYKSINQVRVEYPNVIRSFKNGRFPPEVVQGLSMVLDECEGKPLIIRSSSLLEDSLGASFSGKYKSLFLANQGSKRECLEALMDAIAEVYASSFGPDPIEYRAERGLLDFAEEMGILIQEVIGTRMGDYFLPAFAGVAFSRNEFRWSPRIKREDGLIRLVPGLGTRAVDRVSDDYPILVAPGQPGLRVNVAPEEIAHYSPKMIDVINLRSNTFETVEISELLRTHGDDYPNIEKMVLVNKGGHMHKPMPMSIDFEKDDLLMTCEGLLSDTPFVRKVRAILETLEETIGNPVDIEFAHDGNDFYLLQCRPQSYSEDIAPSPIPKDVSEKDIVFSADRYVSNGRVPDITHVVYVDPVKYGEISSREELLEVGRAVSRLNKILPKRQFVLMGPGRWGSRGDIRLGVSVTYSDINNTAVLMEIARSKGGYKPDLSFGTHFFQDLVEGQIRYLPLYPDDEGTVFNDRFFSISKNLLPDVLPEYAGLADTIKLIDVPKATKGRVLRVLMNADLGEALGILADPTEDREEITEMEAEAKKPTDHLWMWRLRMAEHIASRLDPERFGVVGFYVFGSTKNATAGLASDIDLLVHFRGTQDQRNDLMTWLEAWSLCLDEINYNRTGYRSGGLLDVHVVTDEDIENKTSYAVKIGAVTDPARPLKLKDPGEG